jgi:hypothetical protein
MLTPDQVKDFFVSPLVKKNYQNSDCNDVPAALPDASLDFLIEVCTKLGIQRIFEFGSGRSTKALLSHKFSVTSLEDNQYWMNQTLKTLEENEKINHTAFVKPLKTRFLGLFPVFDWNISSELAKSISEADLILVDSPYYVPYRESTLWSALKYSKGAFVIIDDTRIPTLQRFCNRLFLSNPSLIHTRVGVGHSFDIFYHKSEEKLHLNHSIMDIAKGWRRYILGRKFVLNQNKDRKVKKLVII